LVARTQKKRNVDKKRTGGKRPIKEGETTRRKKGLSIGGQTGRTRSFMLSPKKKKQKGKGMYYENSPIDKYKRKSNEKTKDSKRKSWLKKRARG